MDTDGASPPFESLDFGDWLQMGIRLGYCSDVVCNTHDGLPSTDEEDAEWEAGHDPCVPAIRLYDPLEGL